MIVDDCNGVSDIDVDKSFFLFLLLDCDLGGGFMGISGGGNVFLVFDLDFLGIFHPTTFASFGKGVIGGKLITLVKNSFILAVDECLELLALLE